MNPLKRIIIAGSLVLVTGLPACADDYLKDFINDARNELNSFRDKALAERKAFLDEALKDLKKWAAAPWEPKPMEKPVKKPIDEEPVPPVIIPRNEPSPIPKEQPVRDNPFIAPAPKPQPPAPVPVIPPAPPVSNPDIFTFYSYGTKYDVDADISLKNNYPTQHGIKPFDALNTYFGTFDNDAVDRLCSSLISEANKHNLSDWAFFKLLDHFTEAFSPDNINLQKVLKGIILTLAGFDIKYGGADELNRIYVLTACNDVIVGQDFYKDGERRYYAFENTPDDISISDADFRNPQIMSVQPRGNENFDFKPGPSRIIKICTHDPHCYQNNCRTPLEEIKISINQNRMDFYNDCPVYINLNNEYSQWTTYVNTVLSTEAKNVLYPKLKILIEGKSQLEAANILMKFVEAFDYKRDIEVWGVQDRALFPEETLNYPYRDCEDGAILFTRLVRDLLHIPSALVYYPGHLAAAAVFDNPVNGAYLISAGKKYIICDPTYYYVNVGVQMPESVVDASKAVLIPIN